MDALVPGADVTGGGGSDGDGPLCRLRAMTPVRAARCSTGDRLDATADPLDERGLHVPSVLRCDTYPPTLGCERQYRPPNGRLDSGVSVAVERRTVSLWPVDGSPVGSRSPRPDGAAPAQHTAETEDPATEALAAITSSYRHGRAGIISGETSPSPGQRAAESPTAPALPVHLPTVPLAFLPDRTPAEVAPSVPADEDREVATFWSRLGRTRRPAPRGRHSPKS
jgi:hypothetical protein